MSIKLEINRDLIRCIVRGGLSLCVNIKSVNAYQVNRLLCPFLYSINMQNPIDSKASGTDKAKCSYYILTACTVMSPKDAAVHRKNATLIPVKPSEVHRGTLLTCVFV